MYHLLEIVMAFEDGHIPFEICVEGDAALAAAWARCEEAETLIALILDESQNESIWVRVQFARAEVTARLARGVVRDNVADFSLALHGRVYSETIPLADVYDNCGHGSQSWRNASLRIADRVAVNLVRDHHLPPTIAALVAACEARPR
jgi:hypothetical protein